MAVPPQNGCAGEVKIASSSTYSQLPANSCLAAMRATTECLRPPAPATTTGSPTLAEFELPIGNAGQAEPRQRLHQAESSLLIIGKHMAGNGRPSGRWIQTVSASVIR